MIDIAPALTFSEGANGTEVKAERRKQGKLKEQMIRGRPELDA